MSLLKCVFLKIIQKAHFKKGHFPFEMCLSIKIKKTHFKRHISKDTFSKDTFPLKKAKLQYSERDIFLSR